MTNNKIKNGQPIILGLAGKAGSGKTTVAEQIVPKGAIESSQGSIKWDHIFYALPLYEMASIKKNIVGHNEKPRKLYALHETLFDVYGGSAIGNIPSYEVLIEKVKQIYGMPIEPEGIKPRKFLQNAGDICRDFDPNCFANWAIIKANKLYRQFAKQNEDADYESNFGVIISDVRYANEAKSILKQPNGFVLVFDAEEETLNNRILKRDGKLMSEDESSHSSESQIEEIKNIASAVIKTDLMSIEDQALETINYINSMKEAINA
jgi:dephospho-CoA kinase